MSMTIGTQPLQGDFKRLEKCLFRRHHSPREYVVAFSKRARTFVSLVVTSDVPSYQTELMYCFHDRDARMKTMTGSVFEGFSPT